MSGIQIFTWNPWQKASNAIYYLSNVWIGTSSAFHPVEVWTDSAAYQMALRTFANGAAGANFRVMRGRGTGAAPLRLRANDVITGYNGFSYYAAGDADAASVNATSANAQFQFYSQVAATSTDRGSGFKLNLAPVGATLVQTELQVYNDGSVLHFNLPNIPRAAGAAPAGLVAGDVWADTAAGNVLKVV